MLSKFSVRKPYTVLVAVIMIIVLGIVSFSRMTTDLLPTIELPYVIVSTAYPGASPERVEQTVTRPLEAVLGTASGLKNISSVSNEHSSMIILEYEQSTNMDSAMIELSGSIDMISAQMADEVGTPMMLRINADMLPIMVASVDREGLNIDEISKFAEDTVIPSFERLEGVATVSAEGLLEKQLEIRLNNDGIDKINRQVRAELQKTFDEKRAEIEDARAKLEDGQLALDTEGPQQKDELARATVEVSNAIASLNGLIAEEALLNAQEQAFVQEKTALKQVVDLDTMLSQVFPDGVSALSPDQFAAVMQQMSANLPPELAGMTQEQIAQINSQADTAMSRLAAIETELQNINVRKMTLSAMMPQLEQGLNEAKAGYTQLESGKMTAATELAKAQVQLENGQAELEKGLTEFDKAEEDALDAADLRNIITEEMIKGIIAAQNFSMPAGYISEGQEQHLVKVGDNFASLEELEQLVLMEIEPVGDVKLTDIANIEITDNSDEMYAKVNGNTGILISFQKQSTASTAEVANAISAQIEKLEQEYEGLSITPLMNQGDYINMITGSVLQNLLLGGALAILVLLLFLRDIRPTVVIAFSIPISLMFAVTMMFFSNVTLNIISLSGLALGVGMLVDNSIVVIENIYRLRHKGYSASKAAIEGAKQVSGAIFASTLTTICVFLPIVFTEGLSRQLFTDMGLTIGFSLIASLIIALTLVPAMGATALKSVREKEHHWFDIVNRGYEKLLRVALHRKAIVLTIVTALLAFSIYGVTIMGTAFMADMDSPQMSASMTMPQGSSREDTYAMNDLISSRIIEIEAVETVGAMAGGGTAGFMGGGGDGTSFYIMLREDRSLTNKDVERLIYEKTADLDVEMSVTASNMDMSALGGSGIAVNVRGNDLDEMAEIARDVADIMRGVEGTAKVTTGLEDSGRETRVIVDKAAAMREGLTVAQIFGDLSKKLTAQSQATVLNTEQEEYPVVMINTGRLSITRENLADFEFNIKKQDGTEEVVKLQDIAEITEAESLKSIRRSGQSRYMTVNAEVADGYNIGLVSREFDDKMAEYEVPAGFELEITGENESIQDAMGDLVLMIALAVIFIYLIMVAQFQDLLSPFIVLFTLPLAFTGGLLLLWVSGMELSVIAILGFLVLAGIVVNNGIVFVSYVNQLREEGMEQKEALVTAGTTRIRPILMTALTTILAMSTMALGLGSGAEMMQPMAVVTIGGLTYATLLTLLVVPVLYDLFHRRAKSRRFLAVDSVEETEVEPR
ncbi:MAG: MMPL family transporter [Clostridiaceae bacterium]|nr:MMPL family transporter [Clostridiaceae bacterium]